MTSDHQPSSQAARRRRSEETIRGKVGMRRRNERKETKMGEMDGWDGMTGNEE